ncbi:hypothetical protein C2845_PM13G12260 [Panicum miliaceum]|uniref:Neprosin PEP catalytic domain-containing protein n=1 Tax=Panicum miliaceum TaxID=4540 RepID=A0A3L6RKD1_PANMI|nr:hypothetical protein C2845_PM13G12260 [Panicum miliaceum]
MRRYALIIFIALSCLLLRSAGAGRSGLPEEDGIALETELKMLNKPYVKSFNDKYAVVFDCVDMYKQPAFDHPLLKNHKLQFAQLLINSEEGSKFQAAGAVLEVDAIAVPAGQVSSAQILLVDDSSSRISAIQSGWSADPPHEVDSQTRFMTFWTDGQTGNWQVFLNEQIIGYFPKEIINGMSGATEVQMGGITYSPSGQKSPPMGSGVAPVPGQNTLASKFIEVGVQGAKIGKHWVTKDVSDPAIYNVVMTSVTGPEGNSFQYGGPGGA